MENESKIKRNLIGKQILGVIMSKIFILQYCDVDYVANIMSFFSKEDVEEYRDYLYKVGDFLTQIADEIDSDTFEKIESMLIRTDFYSSICISECQLSNISKIDDPFIHLSDEDLKKQYDESIQWRDWGNCDIIKEEQKRRLDAKSSRIDR